MPGRLYQFCCLILLPPLLCLVAASNSLSISPETILIGLNIPLSGPYRAQGIDQLRAYTLAIESINHNGGLLGRQLVYLVRDSQTKPEIAALNAQAMINEGARLITGGSSSAEAIALAKVCQENKVLFLAGLSHANETTGLYAQRYSFRWFHNGHQSAKALLPVMRQRFGVEARYAFIYADYNWGQNVVDSMTREIKASGGKVLLTLPTPLGATSFFKELIEVRRHHPDVLVLVHFGADLHHSLRQTRLLNPERKIAVVAPLIELNMAHTMGVEQTAGVLTTKSWYHGLAARYPGSATFVGAFFERYRRKPGNAAAVAWVNIHQYAEVVTATGSFDPRELVPALEGHHFTLLTSEEYWRDWDHQGIHNNYIMAGKWPKQATDEWDLFEVLAEIPGEQLARTHSENPIKLPPLD